MPPRHVPGQSSVVDPPSSVHPLDRLVGDGDQRGRGPDGDSSSRPLHQLEINIGRLPAKASNRRVRSLDHEDPERGPDAFDQILVALFSIIF